MPEKNKPFNSKEEDDRNLFSDDADSIAEELRRSRSEEENIPQEAEGSFFEKEGDPAFLEEKRPNPVRRILLIAASIVAGIAFGVGGYLFFTAGNKPAPKGVQAVKALPAPAAVAVPSAVPSEKSKVIPEVPVKAEPLKPETAQAKKEPAEKAEAGKPGKETAPATAAKPEEKKPLPQKQAGADKAPAAAKGGYYVQTGLFEQEANAKGMADTLKQKGYTPVVLKFEGKGNKVMFRVTAGTYANRKEAVEVSGTLKKQGIESIVHKQ